MFYRLCQRAFTLVFATARICGSDIRHIHPRAKSNELLSRSTEENTYRRPPVAPMLTLPPLVRKTSRSTLGGGACLRVGHVMRARSCIATQVAPIQDEMGVLQ
jgi:hypothetical protein